MSALFATSVYDYDAPTFDTTALFHNHNYFFIREQKHYNNVRSCCAGHYDPFFTPYFPLERGVHEMKPRRQQQEKEHAGKETREEKTQIRIKCLDFLKISGAVFGNLRASPGPGVAGNGFSAKNDSQFRGRDSNPCLGTHFVAIFRFSVGAKTQ